jgi:hypothetical protein
VNHFVFNGDADGLCALQQLRLDDRADANLLTGAKRDIDLVKRVKAGPHDQVTVLDLSYAVNAKAVRRLLDEGVRVRYFDHHHAGDIPEHPLLDAHIDTAPLVCTSALVNSHLQGRHRLWAVTGAFGDNLEELATELASSLGPGALATLRDLGESLNYNSYGESAQELFIAPDALHERLIRYRNPLDFAAADPLFEQLREALATDLARAEHSAQFAGTVSATVYVLPDSPWARRVSGVWAHALARRYAARAHAIATPNSRGGYVISVRAPLAQPRGASVVCRQFPTGGGREAAAGINHLPLERLDEFCAAFMRFFKCA